MSADLWAGDVRLSNVDWKAVHACAASPKTTGAIAFAIVSETAHTMATVLGISTAQFDTSVAGMIHFEPGGVAYCDRHGEASRVKLS